jgi:hypothetical protein
MEPRPRPARRDSPVRPTASTAILRRRSSSAVRPRQPDELSGAALASFLHCAVDVPSGLLTSYVVSVVHRRRVAWGDLDRYVDHI